jgi:hypothetical protein
MNKILSNVTCIILWLLAGQLYGLGNLNGVTTSRMSDGKLVRTYLWSDSRYKEALSEPEFTPSSESLHETDFSFWYSNHNPGSSTEVHRSTTEVGGYQLIATIPATGSEQQFSDSNLKPRTTFYYKLRAVSGGMYSDYNDPIAIKTESKFYNPVLTATTDDYLNVDLQLDDRSYQDAYYQISRTREGSAEVVNLGQFTAADSGASILFGDHPDLPNTKYTYTVDAVTTSESDYFYDNVASVTIQTKGETLQPPYFDHYSSPYYNETDLAFYFYNNNLESGTEIYRSLTEEGGYQLIYTAPPGTGDYTDYNLKPRTTYYYKLRAVLDTSAAVSEFSEVYNAGTLSKFYNPTLTARVLNGNTIELTFVDNTYQDYGYEIERSPSSPQYMPVYAPDSGQTFIITDTFVNPNTTYTYSVTAYTLGEGWPEYKNTAVVTVTTETDALTVSSFTLVDPNTDQDIGPLNEGDLVDPSAKPNIRANTDSRTSSVIFYLNGVKRVENEAPYAYFTDAKGDYRPGRLKPGYYELEATPYSDNNGKGTKGLTTKVSFYVSTPSTATAMMQETADVNTVSLYPNPAISQSMLEIEGAPGSNVNVQVLDLSGNFMSNLHQGALDEDGVLQKELSVGHLNKGTYMVLIKVDDKQIMKRLVIDK